MATESIPRRMENRGLLTGDDRAFFEGEKEVEDPDKVRREKRFNIRRRIEHIKEDLDILREAEEETLVNEFYAEVGRLEQVQEAIVELEELREKLNDEGDGED